jgi:hypothetical protein
MSVPCRPGTPHTGLKPRHSVGHATTSCHVSLNFGPCIFAEEGSSANTCPSTPDSTPPPRWEGLQRCHVCCGSGPRLPTGEGFGTATCPTTLNPASLRKAPTSPCVPLKSSFALDINTLVAVIGFQLLRGHLLGPRSSCNCLALSYKRTGQTLNSNKFNSNLNKHTQQYNSSGHRVLCSGSLKHLKILVSTQLDPSNQAYERFSPSNNEPHRAALVAVPVEVLSCFDIWCGR